MRGLQSFAGLAHFRPDGVAARQQIRSRVASRAVHELQSIKAEMNHVRDARHRAIERKRFGESVFIILLSVI